jgi:glycosyltransferase involved in cell wall biosynthesis/predicted ATP-grasp superfamily ATP-dependent carboligase
VNIIAHNDSSLILDGELRASLAVIRSLGKRNFEIIASSHLPNAISGASKYTNIFLHSPSIVAGEGPFITWLKSVVIHFKPKFLLPIAGSTLELVLRHEIWFREHTILPFPSYNQFTQANNKQTVLEMASSLNITHPKTFAFKSDSDISEGVLRKALGNFTYPLCLKPAISDYFANGRLIKLRASYPENELEIINAVKDIKKLYHSIPLLLQEKISGHAVGVFVLVFKGEIKALFSHRRILEKPPSGGVSVLSESIPIGERELAATRELCKHINWSGALMVEFKVDASGTPYLMEINPRFWGSLQLAVDCGIDFPYLLCKLYNEQEAIQHTKYTHGLRLRWILGTLDHLIISIKNSPVNAFSNLFIRNKLYIFSNFQNTKFEVCRTDDIKPFFREIRNYFLPFIKPKAKVKYLNKNSKPLRILFFIESGGIGGAEKVVLTLATSLQSKGHKILVATLRTGWLTTALKKEGTQHIQIKSGKGLDYKLIFQLVRLLKKEEIDVLHTHLLDSNFYGSVAARIASVRHIATEHGDVHHTDSKKFLKLKVKIPYVLGSIFTTVSKFTKTRLTELGVKGKGIHCVYNPICIHNNNTNTRDNIRKDFGIEEDEWVWIHIANIRPIKNQELLIKAYAKAAAQTSNQRLLFVGDGEAREALEGLAKQLGVDDKILFLGFKENTKDLLLAADGFILSSHSESMPISLLEAGTLGLYIVSTNVGGVNEVIKHNITGFLATPNNEQSLAEGIMLAINSPGKAKEMGLKAKEFIQQKCAVASVLEQYLKIYSRH